ncbi:MAG: DUF6094 domain-containing protein [Moorellales bacterium]
MRLAGQAKAGYYPTPAVVVDRLKRLLKFPEEPFAALDPCCGEGDALARLLDGTSGRGYGVELDLGRAARAGEKLYRVAPGAFELAKVPARAFSLLFLNPPYDWEVGSAAVQERKELVFLREATGLLVEGGVLVYIVPEKAYDQRVCRYLDYRYRDIRLWRFPDGEYEVFRQTVLMAVKKERPSASEGRVKKLQEYAAARLFRVLPEGAEPLYEVPPSDPEVEIQGGALMPEEAEEAVKASPVWRRLDAYFAAFGPRRIEPARPPVPLHAGHVGLLLAAGHLDGVVEAGPDTHLVRGRVVPVEVPVDSDEDEERVLVTYRVKVGVLTPDGGYREF